MRPLATAFRTTAVASIAAAALAAATAPAEAAISCPRGVQTRLTATGACAYGTTSHTLTSLKINMTLLDTGNDGVRAHMDLKIFGHDITGTWTQNYALGQVNGYGKSIRIGRTFGMSSGVYAQLRICAAGLSCTPWRYI